MSFLRNCAAAVAIALIPAACLAVTGCGGSFNASAFGATGSSASPSSSASASASASPSSGPGGLGSSTTSLAGLPGNDVVSEAISDTLSAPQFTAKGILDGTGTGLLRITLQEKSGVCEDTYGVINGNGVFTKGTVTVVVRGSTLWFRADAAFYYANTTRSNAEKSIRMLAGRYIQSTVTAPSATVDAGLCNLRQQWGGWPQGYQDVKGKLTTYGGQRVFALQLGTSEYVYVTDSATPRLVSVIIAESPSQHLSYSFSYAPIPLAAPSARQSVRLRDGGI